MAQEDVELIRSLYERWRRDDPALDLLAADFDWSTPHPGASELRGSKAVGSFIREYRGTWAEWRIEIEDLRDLGEGRVLVRFTEHGRGRGSGAETSVRVEGIWTVCDGKATSFRGRGR